MKILNKNQKINKNSFFFKKKENINLKNKRKIRIKL